MTWLAVYDGHARGGRGECDVNAGKNVNISLSRAVAATSETGRSSGGDFKHDEYGQNQGQ